MIALFVQTYLKSAAGAIKQHRTTGSQCFWSFRILFYARRNEIHHRVKIHTENNVLSSVKCTVQSPKTRQTPCTRKP